MTSEEEECETCGGEGWVYEGIACYVSMSECCGGCSEKKACPECG